MSRSQAVIGRGPLWARPEDLERDRLPWWRAFALALLLELGLPVMLFGVDWSLLPTPEAPPPMKITAVDIPAPPPEPPPPPPPEKKKKPERKPPLLPVEPPVKLPGEKPSKIELPEKPPEPEPEPVKPKKPEPEPEPEPEPVKEPEPTPEPEPEAAALPSVFQDAKPVRKVRIKYPPEAEAKHIQGRVKVRMFVSAEGRVTDAQVLEADPPGVFEEAVLEAVRQYVFKRDGTTYQADQEVIFKIDE